MTLVHPPKLVFDDRGALVEVIVSADDFRTYLRAVAANTPWDELPESWQDAVDRLLIEEVAGERADAVDLDDLLAESNA